MGSYLGAALKADRKSLDAHLAMGYVFLAEGKSKDAIQYFEKAANLSEDRAQGAAYLIAAGRLREQLADTNGAEKDYTEAMSMAGSGQTW